MSLTHAGHSATMSSMRSSLQKMSLGRVGLGARCASTAALSARPTRLAYGGGGGGGSSSSSSSFTLTSKSLSPFLARLPPATVLTLVRTYADSTSAPKKKATTATKKTTRASTAATGKTKKPAKKAAKKPAKKRKAAAAKKKPVKKKAVKKVLTPEAKEKAKIKALKAESLKKEEPKTTNISAWLVFQQDFFKTLRSSADPQTKPSSQSNLKSAAEEFKKQGAGELEALNHRANQKLLAARDQHASWVASKEPATIYRANLARKHLKRLRVPHFLKYRRIEDPRLPKNPTSAFTSFNRERHASGDFRHIKLSEAARLITQEWKELPASDRQRFTQASQADHERYKRERTALGL